MTHIMAIRRWCSTGAVSYTHLMSLHEITSGYFGGGFSYGPRSEIRLTQAVRNRVPLVVTPGGLDFVDFALGEFPDRMDERVYMMHNHKMAHIKILPRCV